MAAPTKFKWAEVLAARGEPVSAIEAKVVRAEKALQDQQAAYGKAKDAKYQHNADACGLSRGKVESLVKPMLSGAAWTFCGKEYVAELYEAL